MRRCRLDRIIALGSLRRFAPAASLSAPMVAAVHQVGSGAHSGAARQLGGAAAVARVAAVVASALSADSGRRRRARRLLAAAATSRRFAPRSASIETDTRRDETRTAARAALRRGSGRSERRRPRSLWRSEHVTVSLLKAESVSTLYSILGSVGCRRESTIGAGCVVSNCWKQLLGPKLFPTVEGPWQLRC